MGKSLNYRYALQNTVFKRREYNRIVVGQVGCKHHLTMMRRRKNRKNSRFLRMECKKCNVRFYLSKWRIHKLVSIPGYTFDTSMVAKLWLPSGYTVIRKDIHG